MISCTKLRKNLLKTWIFVRFCDRKAKKKKKKFLHFYHKNLSKSKSFILFSILEEEYTYISFIFLTKCWNVVKKSWKCGNWTLWEIEESNMLHDFFIFVFNSKGHWRVASTKGHIWDQHVWKPKNPSPYIFIKFFQKFESSMWDFGDLVENVSWYSTKQKHQPFRPLTQ